jgi:hypothetical protein
MGQPSSVTIGATVPDQLGSALENERDALKLLRQGIATVKGAFIQIMPLAWDSFLPPVMDRHPGSRFDWFHIG